MTEQVDYLIEQFFRAVSEDDFTQAADALLIEVNEPKTLAKCAELATHRKFGGGYFRALLWSKAAATTNGNRQFVELCHEIGTTASEASKYVRLGQAIENLHREGVTLHQLRRAHDDVIKSAQRQNSRVEEYLQFADSYLQQNAGATHYQMHRSWCDKNGSVKANLDIIKPSDWWAFGHPKWRSEPDFPGSIPGEIYANALYYFAPATGVAVDPMAGSGTLRRVYDDKHRWERDVEFNLHIHLFDSNPKRDFIIEHDARRSLPVMADWIFLDPPYFGQSSHLYKSALSDATDYMQYLGILAEVIDAMACSLNPGGRLCLLLPKWSGQNFHDINFNIPEDSGQIAQSCGLHWIDFACVSRGRQQEPAGARLNERAKRDRRMRSDTCILNVYERPALT